jgi:hypothetical protein
VTRDMNYEIKKRQTVLGALRLDIDQRHQIIKGNKDKYAFQTLPSICNIHHAWVGKGSAPLCWVKL